MAVSLASSPLGLDANAPSLLSPFISLTIQTCVQDAEKMGTPFPSPENSLDKQALNKLICGKSSPLHPASDNYPALGYAHPFAFSRRFRASSCQPLLILPLSPLPGPFPLALITPRLDFWFGFVRLLLILAHGFLVNHSGL